VKFGTGEPMAHIFTVRSRHEEANVFGSLGLTATFMM
jgi:hypothetical protein